MGFISVHRDITARKEVEEALQREKESYRTLAENLPGLVYRVHLDDHRRMEFFNESLLALTGYTEGELTMGKVCSIEPLIVAEDRAAVVAAVQRAIREHQPFEVEYRLRTKAGDLSHCIEFGQPVYAADGACSHFDGVIVDITRRKRAEELLRASEQRLAIATKGAGIGLFEWDIRTNKTLWTVQQARLLGYPGRRRRSRTTLSQTHHYRDWARRVHPEDLPRVKAALHQGMVSHTLSEADYRVVWPDQSVHWLASRGSCLYDAKGKPERMLGMTMDITERKRMEEQLKELTATLEQRVAERTAALTQANEQLRRTEARLGFLLGSTAAVIYSGRPSGDYGPTFVSENIRAVLGYEAREFVEDASFWAKRVHPEDKFHVFLSLAQLPAQPVQTLEYRFQHKDGTYHWMRDDVRLLKDETGQPQEIVGSWLDVSRQRWMEETRRQSERALTDFFAEAPMGLLWVSPQGRILRANYALASMLGYDIAQLFGRQVAEFGAEPGGMLALILRLAQKDLVQYAQTRLRRADGSILHALVDANGLWEDEKLIHSRWFIRDVTRQVELQKEILAIGERVQRRIGRDLHDDLGQRLASMQYLSQALEQRLAGISRADAARAKEIGQLAREAVIHARDLSHAMTPIELETEGLPMALAALAGRTQKLFLVTCRFRCGAAVSIPDGTAQLYLYRIAQEAIHNAIKHGRAGTIRIGLKAKGGNMVLSVEDDGVGLPLKPRKSQGLGLRIMDYRASVLGGSLVVRRRAGGGTSLVCSVPREATQPPTAHSNGSRRRQGALIKLAALGTPHAAPDRNPLPKAGFPPRSD